MTASCSRDGVRAGRGSPCAVLLPLSMVTSAPWPIRSPLPRTCSGFRSLAVGSSSLSSPPPKCSSQFSVLVCKMKIIAQGEFNPSLPRSSTRDLPPVLSSNPASWRRGSLDASLDLAVVWLVVVPASAHSHVDCALLHGRCCLRKTRESRVFVPDAPRTTQLYYHDEALRLHVAARRYDSLRVSPVLHPPERPTPLTASLIGHASQHALPRP